MRGDVVDVARGYARNYLLPRRMAEVATAAKLAELEKRETQRARHEASTGDQAREIAGRLEALELRFDVNAGPTGSLFGSVTPTGHRRQIWDEAKIRVDRRKIQLPESIKRIGRYEIADRPLRGRHGERADARRARGRRAAARGARGARREPRGAGRGAGRRGGRGGGGRSGRGADGGGVDEPAAEAVRGGGRDGAARHAGGRAGDAVVEEAAAGTLGQTGEPESA